MRLEAHFLNPASQIQSSLLTHFMTPWIRTKRSRTIGLFQRTRYLFAFGRCPSSPRLKRRCLSSPSNHSWLSLKELLASLWDFPSWLFGTGWWGWWYGWWNWRKFPGNEWFLMTDLTVKDRDPVQHRYMSKHHEIQNNLKSLNFINVSVAVAEPAWLWQSDILRKASNFEET